MLRLRSLVWCVVAAALAAPLGERPAAAAVFATRISASTPESLRALGPDAHGGIGDWALGNGTLCAVVSDLDHESALSVQGGVLIDVSHCGRADDHFVLFQPLVNFARDTILPIQSIRAESNPDNAGGAGEARIVTSGTLNGVRLETSYSVSEAWPLEVRIVTVLSRIGPGDRVFLAGDISLHGDRQLAPFGIVTSNLARSRGFAHPAFDVDSALATVRALGAVDLHVLVASDALDPGVAYGLHLRSATLERSDGSRVPLSHLSLNGKSFSLFGAFTRPLWFGDATDPGVLEMAQTLFMDVREGERVRYERAQRR